MSVNLQTKRLSYVENCSVAPKKASTAFAVGEWLAFDVSASQGFLKPAVGNTTLGTQNSSTQSAIEGLCLTYVPSTDETNALITYDGIVDTTDRWAMPVVPTNKITYGTLVGTFTAGETIIGGTSGATAKISTDSGSIIIGNTISGTFVVGETIAGSSATAVITAYAAVNALPNSVLYVGGKYNVGPDSISLDGSVAGTQFMVMQIFSNTEVAVRVLKDNN